jgi:hypothetical protein
MIISHSLVCAFNETITDGVKILDLLFLKPNTTLVIKRESSVFPLCRKSNACQVYNV